ncbi:glycoside hydrolase family 26 protein [Spirilliplanes yamanashiensis]|uniref:GH26 domain-containing protein n=1 Tax=Spirilliplanes yamanashiensis TaxID=42233 RepID=A0A8J4DJJ7_9ACTN|nr:glycosyl hydrolase [Spirilliplanes yamanashiensis]MDP9816012.1 hypothetical protein [Spirilliplanes yamanashiensis]GIJ04272.1 hypothetical protein Sya03_36240 [Spirilliplanes yamanashiensis]
MRRRAPQPHPVAVITLAVTLLVSGSVLVFASFAQDRAATEARRGPDGPTVGWGRPIPGSPPAATASRAPLPAPSTPAGVTPGAAPGADQRPGARPDADPGPEPGGRCRTGAKLVPTCGVLWGVAPGAFTEKRGAPALAEFERKTGRHQDIYHAYHRGRGRVFPTPEEIRIAREPGRERILFLNWKPAGATWAEIAAGDRATDAYLDRLAAHIRKNFPEPFFFTVHHEAEDNVNERAGSGWTARDFAAMYRHVVQRLRAGGASNIVSVVVHMAYVPHTTQEWFDDMYPGDDVVDWIGWDTYAYSDPGYGHGDFTELMNRRASSKPDWPGFYDWAVERHPDKPLMVAEWGVWYSPKNPRHKAEFYRNVGRQITEFPRIKALVGFDTPHNQKGMDSRVDSTPDALEAYRRLGDLPVFQVEHGSGTPGVFP